MTNIPNSDDSLPSRLSLVTSQASDRPSPSATATPRPDGGDKRRATPLTVPGIPTAVTVAAVVVLIGALAWHSGGPMSMLLGVVGVALLVAAVMVGMRIWRKTSGRRSGFGGRTGGGLDGLFRRSGARGGGPAARGGLFSRSGSGGRTAGGPRSGLFGRRAGVAGRASGGGGKPSPLGARRLGDAAGHGSLGRRSPGLGTSPVGASRSRPSRSTLAGQTDAKTGVSRGRATPGSTRRAWLKRAAKLTKAGHKMGRKIQRTVKKPKTATPATPKTSRTSGPTTPNPNQGGNMASRLAELAAEFHAAVASRDPQRIAEVEEDFKALPAALGDIASGLKTMHSRSVDLYPLHPAVSQAVGTVYEALFRAQESSNDVPAAFEAMHEEDLKRHRAPRPGEEMWDVRSAR